MPFFTALIGVALLADATVLEGRLAAWVRLDVDGDLRLVRLIELGFGFLFVGYGYTLSQIATLRRLMSGAAAEIATLRQPKTADHLPPAWYEAPAAIVPVRDMVPGDTEDTGAPAADASDPEQGAPITCAICGRTIATVECPHCNPDS